MEIERKLDIVQLFNDADSIVFEIKSRLSEKRLDWVNFKWGGDDLSDKVVWLEVVITG